MYSRTVNTLALDDIIDTLKRQRISSKVADTRDAMKSIVSVDDDYADILDEAVDNSSGYETGDPLVNLFGRSNARSYSNYGGW